jgi:hypothetical protein
MSLPFNDPTFAPICADETNLFGRGRCPRRRRVFHGKTTDGNIVYSRFFRIEYCLTNIDLDRTLVWINILELRPEGGIRRVNSSKPKLALGYIIRFLTLEHQADPLGSTHGFNLGIERRP